MFSFLFFFETRSGTKNPKFKTEIGYTDIGKWTNADGQPGN